MKRISTFAMILASMFCAAQMAQARGFGGSRSGGESRGGYSGGESRGGESRGGESRGGYGSEGERGGSGSSRGSEGQRGGNEFGGERSSQSSSSRGNYPSGGEEQGRTAAQATPGGYPPGGAGASGYHPATAEESGYHPSGAAHQEYPQSMQGYQATGRAALPTDAGYGASAGGARATGAAANRTTPGTPASNPNAQAAGAAAARNSNAAAGAFNQNWYGAHPDAWHAAGWNTGDEWHAASWGAVAPAAGMTAAVQPAPYAYGAYAPVQTTPAGPDNSGNQPPANASQNYQQAANLAQSAPPSNPQSSDWTPLGVWGLVRNEQSNPHYILQLAVNKSGALAGNYTDLITNSSQTIQGGVDKNTQRVSWTVGDNKTTVGETGLYNLTQNEAPATLYIGGQKAEPWLLVRLAQPPQ